MKQPKSIKTAPLSLLEACFCQNRERYGQTGENLFTIPPQKLNQRTTKGYSKPSIYKTEENPQTPISLKLIIV